MCYVINWLQLKTIKTKYFKEYCNIIKNKHGKPEPTGLQGEQAEVQEEAAEATDQEQQVLRLQELQSGGGRVQEFRTHVRLFLRRLPSHVAAEAGAEEGQLPHSHAHTEVRINLK